MAEQPLTFEALVEFHRTVVVPDNVYGFLAETAGAKMVVFRSAVTNNDVGFINSNSAVFETLRNNNLQGNTTASLGTITLIDPQ